jgi:lipoprotein-anchoring transpeptidase ErfK/SrfK
MSISLMSTRRTFLIHVAISGSVLTGCTTVRPGEQAAEKKPAPVSRPLPLKELSEAELQAHYSETRDGDFVLPAIDYRKIDPRFYPQRVSSPIDLPIGTVVIDTPNRFLYLIERDGTAMRYGVGIGRDGFAWNGDGTIHWRQKWARWKSPHEMIAREPSLEKFSAENGGMAPGLVIH